MLLTAILSATTRCGRRSALSSSMICNCFSSSLAGVPPKLNMVSALDGPPKAALVPPGQCIFGEEFSPATLVAKRPVGTTSRLFTFALPDSTKPLGLSTCACVLAKGNVDGDDAVVRPYTPVSTNALVGYMQFLIKIYPDGKLSSHLDSLPIGAKMDFKHIAPNVKIQYPFNKKRIGMICGGTGVTPMLQALHALLGSPDDTTEVSLLYASKVARDILARETIDRWAEEHKNRFKVTHVLSEEPEDSSWSGERGYVDKARIEKFLPPPDDDHMIFLCGPPPMYDSLCGPRDEKDVTGALGDLGYSSQLVYKF